MGTNIQMRNNNNGVTTLRVVHFAQDQFGEMELKVLGRLSHSGSPQCIAKEIGQIQRQLQFCGFIGEF